MIDFGVRVINLCHHLPENYAGNHIAQQILRSGTAPAAHYAEARNAESQKDFVHKLKLALKELNETRVWLKMIIKSHMQSANRLVHLDNKCHELCKIISTSIKTSRDNN